MSINLEPLNCPKCGAPIQIHDINSIIVCDHCCTSIKATESNEGKIIPIIAEALDSISIQARIRRLENRIATEERSRHELNTQIEKKILADIRPLEEEIKNIEDQKMDQGIKFLSKSVIPIFLGIFLMVVVSCLLSSNDTLMGISMAIGIVLLLIGTINIVIMRHSKNTKYDKINRSLNHKITDIRNEIEKVKEKDQEPIRDFNKKIIEIESQLIRAKNELSENDKKLIDAHSNRRTAVTNNHDYLQPTVENSGIQESINPNEKVFELVLVDSGPLKIDVIKIIRQIPELGLGLVEAKNLIETPNSIVFFSSDINRLNTLRTDLEHSKAIVLIREKHN